METKKTLYFDQNKVLVKTVDGDIIVHETDNITLNKTDYIIKSRHKNISKKSKDDDAVITMTYSLA